MNQAVFSFDISLYDLFGAMALGATVVLNDHVTAADPNKLISRIQKYKCTSWNSTPSFIFICLTEPTFNATTLPHIKAFILAGEELPVRLTQRIGKIFPINPFAMLTGQRKQPFLQHWSLSLLKWNRPKHYLSAIQKVMVKF
jgi:D-alanine--poly(phosphoribitol) ligase subunit 1